MLSSSVCCLIVSHLTSFSTSYRFFTVGCDLRHFHMTCFCFSKSVITMKYWNKKNTWNSDKKICEAFMWNLSVQLITLRIKKKFITKNFGFAVFTMSFFKLWKGWFNINRYQSSWKFHSFFGFSINKNNHNFQSFKENAWKNVGKIHNS